MFATQKQLEGLAARNNKMRIQSNLAVWEKVLKDSEQELRDLCARLKGEPTAHGAQLHEVIRTAKCRVHDRRAELAEVESVIVSHADDLARWDAVKQTDMGDEV